MKIIQAKLNWKQDSKFEKNNPLICIIHHALSRKCTIQDIHAWHLQNGWNGCGYHYFIDKEGNVYQGRLPEWNGCHTKGENNNSLGICLEGCYTNYKPETSQLDLVEKIVPEKQIEALVDLLIYLDKPFAYHRDYTDEKDCPGKYFLDLDILKRLVSEKIRKKVSVQDKNISWMSKNKLILGEHNPEDVVTWAEFALVLKRYSESNNNI